jgi:hypothetical protein
MGRRFYIEATILVLLILFLFMFIYSWVHQPIEGLLLFTSDGIQETNIAAPTAIHATETAIALTNTPMGASK